MCLGNYAAPGSCIYFESADNLSASNLTIKNCISSVLVFSYYITVYVKINGMRIENCSNTNEGSSLITLSTLNFVLKDVNCNSNLVQNTILSLTDTESVVCMNFTLTRNIFLSEVSVVAIRITNSNITYFSDVNSDEIKNAAFLKITDSTLKIYKATITNISFPEFEVALISMENAIFICKAVHFNYNYNPVLYLKSSTILMDFGMFNFNYNQNSKSPDILINNQFAVTLKVYVKNEV